MAKTELVFPDEVPLSDVMGYFVHDVYGDPRTVIVRHDVFMSQDHGLVQFRLWVEKLTDEIPEPPIQDVVNDLPVHETERYETRPVEDIEGIIIHHTAISGTVGPRRVAEYHVEEYGWPGIGYHYMIAPDGTIYQTNYLDTVSHQAGNVNSWTVGIGFQGSFQKEIPTEAQIRAGAWLCTWLCQELHLPHDAISGHKEHAATACPGNQWMSGQRWKDLLMAQVQKCYDEAWTRSGLMGRARSADDGQSCFMIGQPDRSASQEQEPEDQLEPS